VLTQINKDDKSDEFIFFLTPYLEQHLTAFKNTSVYNSIHFFDNSLAAQYANFANTKQMANFILKQIFSIRKQIEFDHVLFLNLSLVLRNPNILNPFKRLPFTFSGILMNSPYRIREKRNNKILQIKREFPLKLLIKNKNCSNIFLLNDKKGVEFYKKWSDKISPIIDPVRISIASDFDVSEYHDIKSDILTFTQIGKLGKYKGTLDIFDAIEEIDAKLLEQIHFLFIGKVNKDIETDIQMLNKTKHKQVTSIRNEFISDQDFSAYIEQSSVILITNKNAENSSGIVNHCLLNNKVVVAPNKGYYKEIFKDYKGVVSYDDKFSLSKAISFATNNFDQLQVDAKKFDNQKFITENSQDKFAKVLLDGIVYS
jgi:glycosyltransferase involved in cell wall biosynthesis